MTIHPGPQPTGPAAPASAPNWTDRSTADPGAAPAGPRRVPPAPWAPTGGRPTATAAATGEEITQVMAGRPAGFVARPPVPGMPPPPARVGWPGPAYPPPPAQRGSRHRQWAWVGAAAAAITVTVCTGVVLAVAGGSDTTSARSVAHPPSSMPSASRQPTEPPPAPTVSLDALPGLLLPLGTVNSIEGATDIRLISDPNAGNAFSELSTDRPECEGVQHPALIEALRGSGYLGVQTQSLQAEGHVIAQAVIDYPSAAAATQFAAQQAQNWTKCNGKPITLTAQAEGSITFTVGTVTNNNGMLSVVLAQEGARGWGCERALTTRDNIVVDTRSCGLNRSGQAITAAAKMADLVNTATR